MKKKTSFVPIRWCRRRNDNDDDHVSIDNKNLIFSSFKCKEKRSCADILIKIDMLFRISLAGNTCRRTTAQAHVIHLYKPSVLPGRTTCSCLDLFAIIHFFLSILLMLRSMRKFQKRKGMFLQQHRTNGRTYWKINDTTAN